MLSCARPVLIRILSFLVHVLCKALQQPMGIERVLKTISRTPPALCTFLQTQESDAFAYFKACAPVNNKGLSKVACSPKRRCYNRSDALLSMGHF